MGGIMMRLIYRFLLFASKDEALYRQTLEKLKEANISCRTDIVSEQYVASHTSTAAGPEVLGRSVKPIQSSMSNQRIYEIYIKPKDKVAAKQLIN